MKEEVQGEGGICVFSSTNIAYKSLPRELGRKGKEEDE